MAFRIHRVLLPQPIPSGEVHESMQVQSPILLLGDE